jgi:glutamyl/glutaminyl-tRNA synthetase
MSALHGRVPERPVTRFAPSPTGHLHIGHVVNAIYVWGVARAFGGRVLFRIEDHDRERSRREFEQSVLDDLEWLGFIPDVPPIEAFRSGIGLGRQSDRADRYERALERLTIAGLTYWCDCSRQRLARDAGHADGELRYDDYCRDRQLGPGPDRGIRLRIAPGDESFLDAYHGVLRQTPATQCGDVLLRDRLGNWTYQFAVAVDDFVDDVTLVIRGLDLLASTGRQLRIARLLGRTTQPVFLHHPLVIGPTGTKLSKSQGDTGVRELRAAGRRPAEVIGRAATLAGLVDAPREIAATNVGELFE